MQQTFSFIKPDGTKRNLEGAILKLIQENQFKIIALKKTKLSLEKAKEFYSIHSHRPFYNDLCNYISSGPIVCFILEKENAVKEYRDLMGATNPKDAQNGTIRQLFGISIDENTVHGSDSEENANIEINFMFQENEKF